MGKEEKTHLNVVVIGHVDSGKSTTVSSTISESLICTRNPPNLAGYHHNILLTLDRPVT